MRFPFGAGGKHREDGHQIRGFANINVAAPQFSGRYAYATGAGIDHYRCTKTLQKINDGLVPLRRVKRKAMYRQRCCAQRTGHQKKRGVRPVAFHLDLPWRTITLPAGQGKSIRIFFAVYGKTRQCRQRHVDVRRRFRCGTQHDATFAGQKRQRHEQAADVLRTDVARQHIGARLEPPLRGKWQFFGTKAYPVLLHGLGKRDQRTLGQTACTGKRRLCVQGSRQRQ